MKTPDEIKKGLETCQGWGNCNDCPYHLLVEGSFGCEEQGCDDSLIPDALAYIQQLEAERDAAVEVMTKIVQECGEPYCEYCGADFKPNCTGRCWTHNEGFKWRGVQKEE